VVVEIGCPSLHDEFEVGGGEIRRREMRLGLAVDSLRTLI
jgi:hypothetical protein